MMKKNILFTKKIDKILTSAIELTDMTVDSFDFIKIKTISFSLPKEEKNIQNIVFTSQNAVKTVAKKFSPNSHQTIYSVGEQTAKLIKSLWETTAITPSKSNTKGIINLIKNNKSDNFLYFCGKKRLKTLEKYFQTSSKHYICKEVYDTILSPPKGLKTDFYDILCFCSPSAVESYLSCYQIKPHQEIVVIGKTTAKELSSYKSQITIVPNPSIVGIIEYLNKKHSTK